MEELSNTLSPSEILSWRAYFSIYPFSQDREDARMALLSYRILQSSIDPKEMRSIHVEDLLPSWSTKATKQQTPDEMKNIAKMISQINNKEVTT